MTATSGAQRLAARYDPETDTLFLDIAPPRSSETREGALAGTYGHDELHTGEVTGLTVLSFLASFAVQYPQVVKQLLSLTDAIEVIPTEDPSSLSPGTLTDRLTRLTQGPGSLKAAP